METDMAAARLVNVIACRTYAVVFGALAVIYLVAGVLGLYWGAFGAPSTLFGHAVSDPFFRPGFWWALAAGVLACGVVSAVLATFAWKRSLVAVSVAFVLWAAVNGASIAMLRGGFADHSIRVIATAVRALLLVAAFATRRQPAGGVTNTAY
jgi:hypothetical protein